MDDLIILVFLAAITGLYLIHRSVSGTLLEKAQLISALASAPTFSSFSIADLPSEPPSPLPNYSLSTASPRISRALWRGVELVISDFVDPWYNKLSPQSDFPNDIRHMFDRSFNAIAVRARRVDWTVFIVRNILTNLNYLLRIYRLTEQHLHKTDPFFSNPRTPQHVRHKLMIEELQRAYRLHPGVGDRDAYLRVVSSAVLSRILSARDWRCEAMRDLLREMLISYCLRLAMSFVEPYWLNVSLINGLKKFQENMNSGAEAANGAPSNTTGGTQAEGGRRDEKGKKEKRSGRKEQRRHEEASASASAPTSRPGTSDPSHSSRTISTAQPIPPTPTHSIHSFSSPRHELSTSAPKLSPVLHDGNEGSVSAPSSPFPMSTSNNSSEAEGEDRTDGEEGDNDSGSEHVEGEWAAESKTHARDGSGDRSDSHMPGDAAEMKEAAEDAKSNGEASRKESLLTQKMLEWNNEREKRKEHELALAAAAASHGLDGQTALPGHVSATSMAGAHHKPPAHPSSSSSSASNSQPTSKRPSSIAHSSSTSHLSTSSRAGSTHWPATNTHLILPPSFLPNFTSIPFKAITSNWEVQIIGSGMKFDPKPFVAYQLAVKNGTLLGQIVSWTMIKRYTHFQHLHSQLKRKMEGVFSAALPKKHLFSNQLDAEFIAQRRKELSTYLNQLLWNKEVLSSAELRHFLIPNEKDFKDLLKWGGNTNVMTPQAAAAALSIGDPTIPLSRPGTAQSVSIAHGAAARSPALAVVQAGVGFAHSPSSNSITPPMGTPNSPAMLPASARALSANAVDNAQHAAGSNGAATLDTTRSMAPLPETAAGPMLPGASPMLMAVQSANGHATAHIASPLTSPTFSSQSSRADPSSASSTPLLSPTSSIISPPSTPRTNSLLLQRPASPRPSTTTYNPAVPQPPHPQTATTSQPQGHVNTPPMLPTAAHPQSALPSTPPRLPAPAAASRARRASRSTPSSTAPPAAAGSSSASHRPRRSQFAAAHFEKEMSESLYRLIEELFDLNSKSFVRRQALWLGKQAVKLTANSMVTGWVRETIGGAVSEQSITGQIEWMTDLVWPNGQFKTGGQPVTEEMKEATKAQAREMLLAAVPGPLQTLFGSGHCERSMERFFAFLQMEPLIQHFALSVLDMLVLTLFPELKAMIKPR